MRVGCLVPLANLVWPLTYLVELAKAEDKYDRLRTPIWTWGTVFLVSTVVSVFSFIRSFFAHDTQAIADNTISFVVANLIAMATIVVLIRLVSAFESAPAVDRPAHRWLVVADEKRSRAESPPEVEPEGREPAA